MWWSENHIIPERLRVGWIIKCGQEPSVRTNKRRRPGEALVSLLLRVYLSLGVCCGVNEQDIKSPDPFIPIKLKFNSNPRGFNLIPSTVVGGW